jgi:hypothetical protein
MTLVNMQLAYWLPDTHLHKPPDLPTTPIHTYPKTSMPTNSTTPTPSTLA